jgi:hypothetical protein
LVATDGRFEKQILNKTNLEDFCRGGFSGRMFQLLDPFLADLLSTQDSSIQLSKALLQPK